MHSCILEPNSQLHSCNKIKYIRSRTFLCKTRPILLERRRRSDRLPAQRSRDFLHSAEALYQGSAPSCHAIKVSNPTPVLPVIQQTLKALYRDRELCQNVRPFTKSLTLVWAISYLTVKWNGVASCRSNVAVSLHFGHVHQAMLQSFHDPCVKIVKHARWNNPRSALQMGYTRLGVIISGNINRYCMLSIVTWIVKNKEFKEPVQSH